MSLLGLLVKKRLTEERFASMFVKSLVKTVELGFPDVAGLINEDQDFAVSPKIPSTNDHEFLLVVLIGNIKLLSENLEGDQETRVRKMVMEKCAQLYETSYDEFCAVYKDYSNLMARLNHPSKNVLYAMTRVVFAKYNLNQFQADYFRSLNTPNPIFLKRMNEVVQNFLWDWEAFFDKYRIN